MSCNGMCDSCTPELRLLNFEAIKEKYPALTAFQYNPIEYSSPTTVMLGVTNRCNLNCEYCFVTQNQLDMTLEIAERSVEWALENYEKKSDYKVSINFFGGEPLLKFNDIIKPLVEKYNEKVYFNITTNGILLDEDIVDFFYKYNVGILLSFDGVPEVQNKQRSNSFNQILNNIPYLLLRFPNTVMRATMTKHSIPYLYDTVLMAEELGFKKVTFCPNAYESWDKGIEKQLYEQFKKIGLHIYRGLRNNNEIIKVDPLVSFFDNANLALNEKLFFNNHVLRCGLGTTTCAVTPTGDIVPCQEKISCPTTILGNIFSGIDYKKHKEFLIDYFTKVNNIKCDLGCSEKECLNCLSNVCPSRLEDLDFKFSTSTCAFIRTATSIASRLHLLCNNSDSTFIRNYFEEEGL